MSKKLAEDSGCSVASILAIVAKTAEYEGIKKENI